MPVQAISTHHEAVIKIEKNVLQDLLYKVLGKTALMV